VVWDEKRDYFNEIVKHYIKSHDINGLPIYNMKHYDALNPAYFTQTLAFFILGLAAFSVRSTYKWLSKRK